MTMPPYYPSNFANSNVFTFDETYTVANTVPISASFIITNNQGQQVFSYSNATVSAAGLGDTTVFAPGLDPISGFVPQIGRNYRVTITMRKTQESTNGSVAWHRPGFIAASDENDLANNTIIEPTFGPGLITYNGSTFIDSASWTLNQWVQIGCNWIPTTSYGFARPRIRINRNQADDGSGYSNANFEISEFSVQPEIKLSDIVAEFGGNSPAKLLNYYQKTINSAIVANVVSSFSEANAILLSEAGYYPTSITKLSDFSTDYGELYPLDNGMIGVVSANELEMINVPGIGNVFQTQGSTWGGVDQVKSYSQVSYFKINSGDTYTITCVKKLVTTPTNDTANTPVVYNGIILFNGANATSAISAITEIGFNYTPLSLGNWTTITTTITGAQILSYAPTAVYGRIYTVDNQYSYIDAVGVGVTEVMNCVVQTSKLSITSTGTLIGGTGVARLYDLSNGDVVRSLSGGTWSAVANITTNSELNGPRQATNLFSRRIFRIGSFFVINSPQNVNIPSSGQIKFSNFYGSQQSAGPQFLTSAFMGTFDANHPISYTLTVYSLQNLPITISLRLARPELTMTGPVSNTVTVSGITYSAETVTFTGNAIYLGVASYPVGFYVDASDAYLTNTISPYYVVDVFPPVWNSQANLGTYGSSLQLSATDPQYQPVAYALANNTTLPSGLTLSATGLISGTPSVAGTTAFSVSASNGPLASYQNFTLTTT